MFACVCVSVCITELTISDRLTCWPTAPLAQCSTANKHTRKERETNKTLFISILSASKSLSSLSHSAASSSSSSHHHFLKYLAFLLWWRAGSAAMGTRELAPVVTVYRSTTSPQPDSECKNSISSDGCWPSILITTGSRANWLMVAHLFADCCFFTQTEFIIVDACVLNWP